MTLNKNLKLSDCVHVFLIMIVFPSGHITQSGSYLKTPPFFGIKTIKRVYLVFKPFHKKTVGYNIM